MKIHFVRHGKAEIDYKEFVNPENNPLSEVGFSQAELVGKVLKKVNFDAFLSSDLPRTRDTSLGINKYLGKDIVYSPLLREIRHVRRLQGKPWTDPEATEYRQLWQEKNATDPLWHYEDEESFEDLKFRAGKAWDYVSGFEAENILVVSHSVFIKTLVGLVLHGDRFDYESFMAHRLFYRVNNCSVSVLDNSLGRWQVSLWNDCGHLQD